MRRVTPAGVLLYTLASILLAACGEDAPTSMSTASAEPSLVTTSTTACEPRTRPGKIVEKVTTPRSWGIAVRDDGLTYFTEPFANGVGITSTATRTVNGFIETGIDPIGAAFSPDGGTAYVTNLLSNTVSVLDVATAQQVGTISTGAASPFVVRVSPDGERLFVATNGNVVLVVATATREIVKSVEVGFAPNGFAVHPDGRIMYVSSFIGGTVSEVDIVTEQVLRTFFVGGTPQDMAVNRKGSRLYVANEQGYLNEIDLFSGEQLPDIPLAAGGFGVGVTPDDGEAYVSEPGAGLVQVFSLQTRKLSRTIDVGGEPRRLAFSQQGKIGAIANMAGYLTFVR
ncbi:MAG TPA: beta-propeller fold lactonase family protein [Gemmatimonadales bacterium]|nr:beta-propeller fold lactonase family protein [Gemmatimonadales bacterium]